MASMRCLNDWSRVSDRPEVVTWDPGATWGLSISIQQDRWSLLQRPSLMNTMPHPAQQKLGSSLITSWCNPRHHPLLTDGIWTSEGEKIWLTSHSCFKAEQVTCKPFFNFTTPRDALWKLHRPRWLCDPTCFGSDSVVRFLKIVCILSINQHRAELHYAALEAKNGAWRATSRELIPSSLTRAVSSCGNSSKIL